MCGIVGILNLTDREPVDESSLQKMLSLTSYRGPDESGIYRDRWVGLGSARLSIIDVAGGQQPIGDETGSSWIVFNGEIFNYPDLRSELEKRGHVFSTHSDTEVALHMYQEYGPKSLDQLNGQFAIAIWNAQDRSLFLARDRMGIRPLFYTIQNGRLIFGSEIKAILASSSVKAEIDPASLRQVFTFWGPISPRTIFKDIYEIPPAHYALVKNGVMDQERYWSLPFSMDEGQLRSETDYQEEFEALLIDATLIRLRADVPVGAYLSGGLDSSVTTALIRKYSNNPLDTFSIAFADPIYDESEHQLQMARHLGTAHQVVHCTHADIARVFPEVVWHTETPILRTAPAPMFLLSKLVHDHAIKVVITGEGADELFGGYDIFKEMIIRRFWARDPSSLKRPLLFKSLYRDIPAFNNTGLAYLMAFFGKNLAETDSPFYSHDLRWSNMARVRRFLNDEEASQSPYDTEAVCLPAGFQSWPPLSKAQYLEIVTFLSSYLLSSQGDRVSMANSVEGRFPYLDYRLVEFGCRLPSQLKIHGLMEKYLLRKVGKKLLPPEIWQRRKRPYRAPIHLSFFTPASNGLMADLLSANALRESGLFKPAAVGQLVRKASSNNQVSESDDMALAGILSTQLLYDQFVRSSHQSTPTFYPVDRIKKIDQTGG